MIFGLVCCFIVYCVIVLSPALHDVFHILMTECSPFVLKVPLNTNQLTKLIFLALSVASQTVLCVCLPKETLNLLSRPAAAIFGAF